MTFENVRAPYDWRDNSPAEDVAPWHPLDRSER
jgi:hypothetical protein